jgi:hypothetical protein
VTPAATLASLLCCAAPVVTLGYLATCAVWPFAACHRCHGTGRLKAPIGRYFRLCRRCDGTGRRIRLGRHLWNEAGRIRRDGTR